jgi:hypothetical protein
MVEPLESDSDSEMGSELPDSGGKSSPRRPASPAPIPRHAWRQHAPLEDTQQIMDATDPVASEEAHAHSDSDAAPAPLVLGMHSQVGLWADGTESGLCVLPCFAALSVSPVHTSW